MGLSATRVEAAVLKHTMSSSLTTNSPCNSGCHIFTLKEVEEIVSPIRRYVTNNSIVRKYVRSSSLTTNSPCKSGCHIFTLKEVEEVVSRTLRCL
ncbi:hypothetical protein J6590_096800 [Homalodisca vitripennis]|nr:hypothetical protein J6590_096800 [Homalodisca vitripennis]